MGQGPLAGVRVVELAGLGPAPFACMMLAELGADVIRVERPTGTVGLGLPPGKDLLNRGRPSVRVDLKSAVGVETVLRLVESADILVEGFRPGVTERLGLGPEQCWRRRPSLVYGRMTGWGQNGPLAQSAGHDVNYLAATGLLHAIGGPAKPTIPLNLVGDFGGGAMYLVVGVLAALLEAKGSGHGQVVDAAIIDGAAHLSTMIWGLMAAGMWSDRRAGNLLDGGTPFYDLYETSDGEHMAVGALEPEFYAEFEQLLGLPRPLPERTDVPHWGELRKQIAERFAAKTQAEWTAIFADSDACVAAVLPLNAAAHHPQMQARGTLVEHEGIVQPAPAPRFSRTMTKLGPGPTRESGVEVLRGWGIDDVDDLVETGVVSRHSEEGP